MIDFDKGIEFKISDSLNPDVKIVTGKISCSYRLPCSAREINESGVLDEVKEEIKDYLHLFIYGDVFEAEHDLYHRVMDAVRDNLVHKIPQAFEDFRQILNKK